MNRRDEIKKRFKELSEYSPSFQNPNGDPYEWHMEADKLLLELINDPEVTEYFNKIDKSYA